jgi:uncharacterized protein (TIGR02147 family)
MEKGLNIFEYIDYKKYLMDWRKAERENSPGLTHEYLCRKLGQRNRSYYSDIEKGRKVIGSGVLDRLIKLLRLKGNEAKYFRALVGYGQPGPYEEKEFWFEQIVELNNTPKMLIDKKTYSYFKEWYHTTIRAFLDICDFRGDYQETARRLYSRITPKQAKESIAILRELGLVKPDEKGCLKPTDKVVTTGDAVRHELLQKYQLANHRILRKILEKDEPDSHNSTQLTVSVSSPAYERILKRISQLRGEIISIAHKDEQRADRVYKIAIHSYPETIKV